MKNIFKKSVFKLLSCLLIFPMVLGTTACGVEKIDNSDNSLEVYCWTAGYGTSWLEEMLIDFENQDWVKEKYPNFKHKLILNDNQGFASNRIPLGERNTIDLFFGMYSPGLHDTEYALDLTDPFYNSEVPGEGIKVIDKVMPALKNVLGFENSKGEERYYFMPWSVSFGGIIYNETIYNKLGLSIPKTTEEFFAELDKVVLLNGSDPNYTHKYSMISSKVTYADYLYPVWWMQYEGIDGYNDFFSAVDYDGIGGSVNVLKQTGRLKSLEQFERLYDQTNGYYDTNSIEWEFKDAQARLLYGDGLMMINGDWFSNEMKVQAQQWQEAGYDYSIRVMKTPVISDIVEKTPSIVTVASTLGKTNDQVLSMVIDEIDSGAVSSSITGISQKDYDRIMQARGVTYANLTGASAYIPAYSSAKNLAVDFLRYMSTDKALGIYAKNTSGARLGFNFDLKTDAPDVYAELGDTLVYKVQKDFQDQVSYSKFHPIPDGSTWDIVYYGGLRVLGEYSELEKKFFQDQTLTAKKILDNIYNYYTYNDAYRWDTVISSAGI